MFDTGGVTYVSESKRLRSSSGHGVDWRTGWTSITPGHIHTAPNFCRVHGDVTHGETGGFVNSPYSFPQYCICYWLSVGTGLFTFDC